MNGFELRHFGSRGQNRTAMLAFKLAQVDWLHLRTWEQPVLLLDEVLAELDPQRRGYLLERGKMFFKRCYAKIIPPI